MGVSRSCAKSSELNIDLIYTYKMSQSNNSMLCGIMITSSQSNNILFLHCTSIQCLMINAPSTLHILLLQSIVCFHHLILE